MKFPQRLLRHLDPGAGREDGRTVGRCHRRLRDHQAHREAWNGRRQPGERLREGDGGCGARGVGEEPAGYPAGFSAPFFVLRYGILADM